MVNPPNNRSDFLLSHGRLKFALKFTVNFFLAGLLEVGELLCRLLTTEVFFILRLFVPFHASLRHVQTCQKQTDPAKTGLVRYLVSNTHGSETCNCHVQRVFFSLSPGSRSRLRCSQSQLRYEKKPSGTQGTVILENTPFEKFI